MDCILPGSSVGGILQARILEWVAIPFFRGSSQPRDWTQVSCIAGRRFNLWASREAPVRKYKKKKKKKKKERKDPDAEKEWRQEVKCMTEDEMVGWYHWFNGHEFEQTLGVGEGQGSLVCYSPRGHKDSDITEQLNNNNLITKFELCKTHREDISKLPLVAVG